MRNIRKQKGAKPQKPIFSWCSTDIKNRVHNQHCFMTGEYCSAQEIIQKERDILHKKNEINAFVVMSFSNVSDVVYEWRIKPFAELLKQNFYFNREKTKLYCFGDQPLSDEVLNELIRTEQPDEKEFQSFREKKRRDLPQHDGQNASEPDEIQLKRQAINDQITEHNNEAYFRCVDRINVVRADSNPSSNFVICNRICQQLQIADLIIVDVSVVNANVFYELGMAVALGKMILPICYSEIFYRKDKKAAIANNQYEHHIDNYPWRRELFEHFGIRFRNDQYTENILKRRDANICDESDNSLRSEESAWETRYYPFRIVKDPVNGFSDQKYAQLPYLEEIDPSIEKDDSRNENDPLNLHRSCTGECTKKEIGQFLYEKLYVSYNFSTYSENTLVVYTMDDFLNRAQAPNCIINYYHAIVRQFSDLKCFYGERVGVLLQPNKIPEDPKDSPRADPHLYSVGDIIQIGMNQATYVAHKKMIKPGDFLILGSDTENDSSEEQPSEEQDQLAQKLHDAWCSNAILFVKTFIRNRGLPVYPSDPVYVKRLKSGLQNDIFEDIRLDSTNFPDSSEYARYFFCLYHVMLRTLKYTNEIVVDISTNAVQAFFWLGAAHGSDTNAITVRREETPEERLKLTGSSEKKDRFIFDVAGLWTAVYRTNDYEGFYEQLAKAQSGIEQRSHLILRNRMNYEEQINDLFWEKSLDAPQKRRDRETPTGLRALFEMKRINECTELESYYRSRFWRPMLRYNRLRIYLPKLTNDSGEAITPVWDLDAVGTLSHYLSKKQQIGEYQIETLGKDEIADNENEVNYIYVGGMGEKTKQSIIKINPQASSSVFSVFDGSKPKKNSITIQFNEEACEEHERDYRGFVLKDSDPSAVYTALWVQAPREKCFQCSFLDRRESSADPGITGKVIKAEQEDENELQQTVARTFCLFDKSSTTEDASDAQKEFYHYQLAQLLLWNDRSSTSQNNCKVFISGTSGPATNALASIFVDDPLKKHPLPEFPVEQPEAKQEIKVFQGSSTEKTKREETFSQRFPLQKLQEEIRASFIRKIRSRLLDDACKKLVDTFDRDDDYKKYMHENSITQRQIQEYFVLVADSTEYYLSTVLYRYFLPFLSDENIHRIYNGLRIYISSARAENISPYAFDYPKHVFDSFHSIIPSQIIEYAIDTVPRITKELLEQFYGIEVFYVVKVKGSTASTDQRDVVSIQQLDDIAVKCLFRKN